MKDHRYIPRQLELVFHVGYGLLEVPKQVVDVPQLPVCGALGRGRVELVGDDEALLVADQRLRQVAHRVVRAAQAAVAALLVPQALRLQ